jgi:hypothetical protein
VSLETAATTSLIISSSRAGPSADDGRRSQARVDQIRRRRRLERPGHRLDLGENVDAGIVAFDHVLQAAHLALDTPQPRRTVTDADRVATHSFLPLYARSWLGGRRPTPVFVVGLWGALVVRTFTPLVSTIDGSNVAERADVEHPWLPRIATGEGPQPRRSHPSAPPHRGFECSPTDSETTDATVTAVAAWSKVG